MRRLLGQRLPKGEALLGTCRGGRSSPSSRCHRPSSWTRRGGDTHTTCMVSAMMQLDEAMTTMFEGVVPYLHDNPLVTALQLPVARTLTDNTVNVQAGEQVVDCSNDARTKRTSTRTRGRASRLDSRMGSLLFSSFSRHDRNKCTARRGRGAFPVATR